MSNYAYFVNGNFLVRANGNAILRTTQSADGNSWSAPTPITINGVVNQNAVDPNVVALSNGQFLMMFNFQNDGFPNPPPVPAVYTAISTDGINFTSAQPAFSNPSGATLTDPTEVQLPNGTFLAEVATQTTGPGGNPAGNYIAFYSSTDGRNFVPTG